MGVRDSSSPFVHGDEIMQMQSAIAIRGNQLVTELDKMDFAEILALDEFLADLIRKEIRSGVRP